MNYDLATDNQGNALSMTQHSDDLGLLLSSMAPTLNPNTYVFVSVSHGTDISRFSPVATMQETEGISLILPEFEASKFNLTVILRCAWITLKVHSDLQAVGLTAAFAKALGDAGISCNVVAGAYHDHIFVPVDNALRAMNSLRQLQRSAQQLHDAGSAWMQSCSEVDKFDSRIVRLEVRWRPRDDIFGTGIDMSCLGTSEEVVRKAVHYIEGTHITTTVIKHEDRAQADRFVNYSLQDIESAINEVTGALPSDMDSVVWVDFGFKTIRIHGAGFSPTTEQMLGRVEADICVLIWSHPMTRQQLPPAAVGARY